MAKINEDSILFIKKFYDDMKKTREGEVTMSPEAHKAHVQKIWPGIKGELEKAVEDGRVLYIRAQTDTKILPKEESKDGKVHTVMGDQVGYLFILKVPEKEVK